MPEGFGLPGRRQGVTLIEVAVLIIVTGILAIYTVQSLHIAGEREGLAAERLASDLREATWGYLQSAISDLHEPGYYRDYGRRHLARFLAGVETVV